MNDTHKPDCPECGEELVKRRKKWLSLSQVFNHAAMFGIGIGWGRDECVFAVIVQFAQWVLIIGPHLPPRRDYPDWARGK